MNIEEATARVLDVLNELDISYVVVGAFAVNYHGIVRATRDADFVAVVGHSQMDAMVRKLGQGFHLDPQLSFESATGTTRFILHHLDQENKPQHIELFRLSDDDFDRARFERRIRVRLLDRPAYVLTAEDVIITKLRWYLALSRSKDKDDARGVMAVQGDRLDWAYIRHWCDIHGSRELLEAVHASIPAL
jgi:hypothetical protein